MFVWHNACWLAVIKNRHRTMRQQNPKDANHLINADKVNMRKQPQEWQKETEPFHKGADKSVALETKQTLKSDAKSFTVVGRFDTSKTEKKT